MSELFLNSYVFKFITDDRDMFYEFAIHIENSYKFNICSNMNDFADWLFRFAYETTYIMAEMQNETHIDKIFKHIHIDGEFNIFCKMNVSINGSDQLIPTRMKIGKIILKNKDILRSTINSNQKMKIAKHVQHQFAEYERGNRYEITIDELQFNSRWNVPNTKLDFWKRLGVEWK